ncbi:phosphoribosylaminoimidazole carboxylase ATPase subunit [Actinobacillus seminis]|uniref:Phosphoribosylaminoimidazole carboxylase ATPase subunit n=1 Tax=Actinobacillus seminis TaxID=722 RepID=A0A380V997_9PAST|nr:phosphoribosylaminoimidazole carboxylase ATPase subunit [Actinobacillus seminis]
MQTNALYPPVYILGNGQLGRILPSPPAHFSIAFT